MLGEWFQRLTGTQMVPDNPRPVPAATDAATQVAPDMDRVQDHRSGRHTQGAEEHRREVLLRMEPRKRWAASIKPRSRRFKEIVAIFEEKLKDPKTTVQDILDDYFTRHERELLVPANKRQNRVLARIQRRNRVRYRMLVRSHRFSTWADQASCLHLKLAMLWFGLPVAPIEFGAENGLESDGDTADDIAEAETDERREEAAMNENTLRFLNSYGERHFGKDHVERPDPTYEAYYALNHLYPVAQRKDRAGTRQQPATISLRGGGLSAGLVDMDLENFNESDIDVEDLNATDGSDSELVGDDYAELRVPRRGGAGETSHPLMKTAMEVGDSLYRPRDAPKPASSVRFQPVRVEAENEEVEEGSGAGTKSATAKGKEPERDMPVGSGQFVKPAIPNHIPQPLSEEDRQREQREATYSKPPSVHTDNRIPQNAPPIEKVLQPGSDNLPSISLGVLTPTEQRNLQINYYHMRNVLLERSQKCPYRGCDRVIPLAEEDRMQQHLAAAHTGDRCNFCDEVLYQHWTVDQRRAHFLSNHIDLFLNRWHVEDDNSFRAGARPHGQVDWARESRFRWCPRCGRDHNTLDAKPDREHHDSVCYPGAPEGEWVACEQCGVIHDPIIRHKCREVANTREWPYCHRCGLAMGLFSDLYRARHQLHCMGFYTDDARRCPWCQVDLEEGPLKSQRLAHIENCDNKPDPSAQGPLDPETGEPWPYKPALQEVEGEKEQEPPQVCPLCEKTIIQFDAHLLLRHIEESHPDFTHFCIFCKLDYVKRGWTDDRQSIVLHLDDHIHDRKARMAADLARTMDLPRNHPYWRKVIRQKDHADLKDMSELEYYKKLYDVLWRSSRQQLDEADEDKEQIATLREELLKKEEEVAEVKKLQAVRANKGGESRHPAGAAAAPMQPFANPFAPAAPATPAIPGPAIPAPAIPAPTATGQKKDSGKPKSKPSPLQKENARPPSTTVTTSTATPTAAKRKAARHPTAVAAHDPSYKPTPSDSDTSTDEELRKEEARLKRDNKRKKTVRQDPSYRPRAGEEEGDEGDEEKEERIRRRLKGVRPSRKPLGPRDPYARERPEEESSSSGGMPRKRKTT